MGDLFDTVRARPVFYKMGVFDDARNKSRFIQAPFMMVQIPSAPGEPFEDFLMPFGPTGIDPRWPQVQLPDVNNTGWEREGLWLDMDGIIFMEEHELGSYTSHPDDWRGCFEIGII